MPQAVLGEVEHHVLLAILRLGTDAYSVAIFNELESSAGRNVSLAAIYVALRRLEKKELLESRLVDPSDGGKASHPRRYVRLTSKALQMMRGSRQAFLKLWDGVEPVLDEQP